MEWPKETRVVSKKKPDPGLIQFRTGKVLEDKIRRTSRLWKQTPNETARRLCLLALAGLKSGHHEQIVELAAALGDPSDIATAIQSYLVGIILMKPSAEDLDVDSDMDDTATARLREMIERVKEDKQSNA